MAAQRDSSSRRSSGAVLPERFVGRERELAELETGLDDALSGRGRLFFFVGEPGIGKTRLAEEIADRAAERGARIVWGRAWEAEGAPPYWPWTQILRRLVEEVDAGEIGHRVGTGLPYVAQLLPEAATIPGSKPRPDTDPPAGGSSGDPARQRFRLFDAVTRFIVATAAERPHVIVLDDLQWADVPSLLLLRFLAREIRSSPVLVLGTWRDVEARSEKQVGETLSSLAREGQLIHLGGLSEAEVGRLVSAWDHAHASEQLIANVHQVTKGNPFFVDGIVRLLAANPEAVESGALPIPDEVRDAVRRRLRPLGDELRGLLTLAAVLGREFEHRALAAVSGSTATAIASRLEEAGHLGILAPGGTPVRSRFAHDLFREVLYGDLSTEARMAHHARVGSALESLYGENADAHAAELALHYSSALPAADPEKAVGYGALAARQAMSSYAWEDAIGELERALVALESIPEPDGRRRLGLLLDLGDAIWRSEDPGRFREVFSEAVALARKLSLPRELARAVLGIAGANYGTPDTQPEKTIQLLEEALSSLGEEDLVLRGRLLIELSWKTSSLQADWWAGELRDEGSRTLTEEGVRVARLARDPVLLAHALRRRHLTLIGPLETLPERTVLVEEMHEVARRSGDPEVLLVTTGPRFMHLLETGDPVALEAELTAFVRTADDVRDPDALFFSAMCQVTHALLTGRFEIAERVSAAVLASGSALSVESAQHTKDVQQYVLDYERGSIADLVPTIRKYIRYPTWHASLVRAFAELGRADEARSELETLEARPDFKALEARRDPQIGVLLPLYCTHLAVVASVLGDTERAEVLYQKLLPYSGLNIVVAAMTCWGAADRYLGMLAATLSRWEDAERHFEAAFALNRRMGARPAVARTQSDYAAMLLRRGAGGDAAKAESLLREAIAEARDLGMARLLEVASEALARVETGTTGAAEPDAAIAVEPAGGPELRRTGDSWSVRYEGEPFILADAKGLHYLVQLLAEPGRELHVLDLVAAVERTPADGTRAHVGDTGEILDERARAEYRSRLETLQDELDEATGNADTGRAERLRQEIEFLGAELSAAYGLGGRARKGGSVAERARKAVANRIRFALDRIGRHDATLASHLRATVRTGLFCVYEPAEPLRWTT